MSVQRQLWFRVGLSLALGCSGNSAPSGPDTDEQGETETSGDVEDTDLIPDTDTGTSTPTTLTDTDTGAGTITTTVGALVTEVAAAPAGGTIYVGHCDIDDAGDIYVTWQQEDGGQDVWLSRSQDGGASFQAPIGIETGPENPMGGWGNSRKPYVTADGTRVAVVYGTSAPISSRVVVSTSLAPLTFAPAVDIGTADTSDVEEFAKPVFQSDGSLAVFFHRTLPGLEEIMVSRESDGWTAESLLGSAPGQPCDCCPQDVLTNQAGTTLLAYRNNISNVRDHFVARAPDFSSSVAGSATHWTTFACPVDGPRLGENDGGDQLLVWADPTQGASRVWISDSTNDGLTWGGDRMVEDAGAGQHRPTIALAEDGTVWVAMDRSGDDALLVSSTDGGATFGGATELITADGALDAAELCSGGGRTGLVGITPGGDLYWIGL